MIKISDVFLTTFKTFKRHGMRAILTTLGVAIGIGAIFFLVCLGYGVQSLTIGQIAALEALQTIEVAPSTAAVPLNKDAVGNLANIPNVQEVSPLLSIPAHIQLDESTGDLVAMGARPSYFRYSGIMADEGRLYKDGEEDKVVATSAVAKLFDIASPSEMLGKPVKFTFFVPTLQEEVEEIKIVKAEERFEIVGIFEHEDIAAVYAPLAYMDRLDVPEYILAKVKVADPNKIDEVKTKITDSGFNAIAVADTLRDLTRIFRISQIVLATFGVIALIVASIGMFNTMTISLLERTREISIMKAVGMESGDVWKLFLFEALFIGFLGGAGGIVLGFLAGQFFNLIINIMAIALGGIRVTLFVYPYWFIFATLGFAIVVAGLTGIFPARRAARINPLEALRYE